MGTEASLRHSRLCEEGACLKVPERGHSSAARGEVHRECPRLVGKLVGHTMESLLCILCALRQCELV